MQIAIDPNSDIPKYQQLVDTIVHGIAENKFHIGEQLPSVNQLCKSQSLSRDTVFKAYTQLKEQGVIASVANKGYYIAKETRKVFLLLDTFKAYKEVLYDSFTKNLPKNVIADVHFHHYNADVFKTLVQDSIGKYSKFIIMPFNTDGIKNVLNTIPNEQLLIIDWDIKSDKHQNKLYQDFGDSFLECLEEAFSLINKYSAFHFIYPNYTHHPITSVENFKKFCLEKQIPYKIITDPNSLDIKKDIAYLSVSDRMLGTFLEQCRTKNLEPGIDVGIISYNETPMKKFIYKGITVISTDFDALGKKAAQFVISDEPMQIHIPTKLIIRKSL